MANELIKGKLYVILKNYVTYNTGLSKVHVTGSWQKTHPTLCFWLATLLRYFSDSLLKDEKNQPPTSTIKLPTSNLSNNPAVSLQPYSCLLLILIFIIFFPYSVYLKITNGFMHIPLAFFFLICEICMLSH